MELQEFKTTIKSDTITAMKAGDKVAVQTLRSITNAITNAEKEKTLVTIVPIDLLSSLAKKRKESIEIYEQVGNIELANDEKAELAIIERYLPSTMDNDALTIEVNKLISEQTDELSKRDMGRLVGEFRTKYPGQDMKFVSGLIMKSLN